MKKVIISAALVCLAGFTYAQKPVAGDVTGEVQLNFQTGAIRSFNDFLKSWYNSLIVVSTPANTFSSIPFDSIEVNIAI